MASPLARVRLRPLTADDLPQMVRWEHDWEIRRALGGPRFDTRSAAAAWLARFGRGRGYAFAVLAADGSLLGDIELQDINWRRREAELRVCLGDKRYWGRGLGQEAVRLALRLAFARLGLRQVYLRVYAGNGRAIGCYRRCGFRAVGRLPARQGAGQDELLLMAARPCA